MGTAANEAHCFVCFCPAVADVAATSKGWLSLGANGALIKSLGILDIKPDMPFLPVSLLWFFLPSLHPLAGD